MAMLWVELCSPKGYIEVITPDICEWAIFGNIWVFGDVDKIILD